MYTPQSAAGSSQTHTGPFYEGRPIRQVRDIVVRGAVDVVFKPDSRPQLSLASEVAEGIRAVKTSISGDTMVIERDSDIGHLVNGFQCINISSGSSRVNVLSFTTFNGRFAVDAHSGGRVMAAICLPYAPDVTHQGTGRVELRQLGQDNINLSLTGVATMKASGTVRHLSARASGHTELDASALVTQSAELHASGVARIDAHVAQHLDSHVSGMGRMNVGGNPAVCRAAMSGLGAMNYI